MQGSWVRSPVGQCGQKGRKKRPLVRSLLSKFLDSDQPSPSSLPGGEHRVGECDCVRGTICRGKDKTVVWDQSGLEF